MWLLLALSFLHQLRGLIEVPVGGLLLDYQMWEAMVLCLHALEALITGTILYKSYDNFYII